MNILVYGWYHNGNLGDDLFKEAFRKLFPEHQFVFVNNIREPQLKNVDAVFFGGGSLLDGKPRISEDALTSLQNMKLFYLGVGGETNIHPIHQTLISQAKLIATRAKESIEKLKQLNPNTIWIPDLVYCLWPEAQLASMKSKSILVIPNIEVVSNWSDVSWKHTAWEHFKNQLAQFLDYMVEKGYSVDFLAMCQNNTMNDHWASAEIINKMVHRNANYRTLTASSFQEATQLASQCFLIISQRFHGVILAEITNKSYIAIHHHDKIKNCFPQRGNFVSYYECSKHKLIKEFDSLKIFNNELGIEVYFKTLVEKVENILYEG